MCVYYCLEAFNTVKHCGLGERVLFVLLFFLGSLRNVFTDRRHPTKIGWSQTHRSQQIKIEHLWCFLDQVYGEGRVCQKKKKQHTPHPVLLAWDEVYQMATIWWGCWDPVRWGCSNSTSLSIIPDTISPTGLQYSLYMWTLIFYFGEDISARLLQPECCRLVWKLFELAGWKKSKQKLIV